MSSATRQQLRLLELSGWAGAFNNAFAMSSATGRAIPAFLAFLLFFAILLPSANGWLTFYSANPRLHGIQITSRTSRESAKTLRSSSS